MNANTTRRHVLGDAIAGLAGAVILAGAGIAMATPETLANGADDRLVDLCDRYMTALDVYERDGGIIDCDKDPLWLSAMDLEEQVEATETRTMAGVVAIARVALHWSRQLDGSELFDTSHTGDWPERVVRDVLRLHGGGVEA